MWECNFSRVSLLFLFSPNKIKMLCLLCRPAPVLLYWLGGEVRQWEHTRALMRDQQIFSIDTLHESVVLRWTCVNTKLSPNQGLNWENAPQNPTVAVIWTKCGLIQSSTSVSQHSGVSLQCSDNVFLCLQVLVQFVAHLLGAVSLTNGG